MLIPMNIKKISGGGSSLTRVVTDITDTSVINLPSSSWAVLSFPTIQGGHYPEDANPATDLIVSMVHIRGVNGSPWIIVSAARSNTILYDNGSEVDTAYNDLVFALTASGVPRVRYGAANQVLDCKALYIKQTIS